MGAKGSQAEQSEDRGDVEGGMGMSEPVLQHKDVIPQQSKAAS